MLEITALVIDDEPNVAKLFYDILESQGIITESVATTREGLERLTQRN